MGQVSGLNGKGKKEEPKKEKRLKMEEKEEEEEEEEEAEDDDNNKSDDDDDDEEDEHEQDGLSVHSPCKPLPSSKQQENSDVELELKLLEALEIYPPVKLGGMHHHFVLYGLTEYLRKSCNRQFTSVDVLKLLDRFYNLEMLKPDDEDSEFLSQEEDFCLPRSYFVKEDS